MILLSPLTCWYGPKIDLGDGLEVRQLSERERADVCKWSYALNGREIAHLKECSWWLYKEWASGQRISPDDEEPRAEMLSEALGVLQMVAHVTDYHLVLEGNMVDGSLVIESSYHGAPYQSLGWRRHIRFEKDRLKDVPVLIRRVQNVVGGNVVRLHIPIRLFGLGLRETEVQIRTLLCTMGLDALTMAGNTKKFGSRLSNLLGANDRIFPPDDVAAIQPDYTVSEVVGDLYELRNEIAHGKRVGLKFLTPTTFRVPGPLQNLDVWKNRPYVEILADCACFLLRNAILKIVLDNDLLADIETEKSWRGRLESAV